MRIVRIGTQNRDDVNRQERRSGVDYYLHESSFADEPVNIGTGTRIWHFCHISGGAVIGAKCSLGQNVFVAGTARIGSNVKIQNNVSVYDGVTLEDDVFCGPSMVFTNVINPRSHVSRKDEYKATLVRRGATIGANVTVVCGTTLGRYCFIGAGAVVTRDVPDYALLVGNPARQIGWMCQCGERLGDPAGGDVGCDRCKARYSLQDGRLRELVELA